MRKITVLSMITLDGVMQAPGGTKEDRSEGFKYGGWTAPYGNGPIPAAFILTESSVTTTGVIIVHYKRPDSFRDRKVKTGTIEA